MVHRIGLRFERRDAALLRSLADRVRGGELGNEAVNVFHQAAVAAETGEPLEVICENPTEAVLMADGYVIYGVTRPAIEELAGL